MKRANTTRYFDETSFHTAMGRRNLPRPRKEPPDGWSKNAPNPMWMLKGHPHLWVKEGYVLRAYQYYSSGNGNAIIWALPANAPFPEPDDCERLEDHFADAPRPPDAVDHFMSVIEGDGTPESFLSASMFVRDVGELGAFWHGCSWDTHSVLFEDPFVTEEKAQKIWEDTGAHRLCLVEDGWEFCGRRPKRWQPRVTWRKGSPCVTFFTHSGLGRDAICRYTDRYRPGSYVSDTDVRYVAEGPGGYVF